MEYQKIQACTKGDVKAQNELYDLYKVKMFGVCMRYAKDRAEAEDFLLEGFHKVFKDLKQFKKGNSLEGWIRRIMMNTALMHIRKKRIFEISINEEITISEARLENDFIQQMNVNEIIHAIQQLPIGYQTIFNLFAIEGFSHQEIAEKLDISASTSRSQYTRAKKSLQKILTGKNMGFKIPS